MGSQAILAGMESPPDTVAAIHVFVELHCPELRGRLDEWSAC